MVVDTDVHHGNGTAAIFHDDETVFTLSIHQENNYPFFKPPSTVDINLPDGIGDDDYLSILEKHLHKAFQNFAPQILFYIAGADPYREDQLGGLGAYDGRAGAERCAGFRICATKWRSSGERAGGRLRAARGGHGEHPCGYRGGSAGCGAAIGASGSVRATSRSTPGQAGADSGSKLRTPHRARHPFA